MTVTSGRGHAVDRQNAAQEGKDDQPFAE